jgi:putative transposase
VIAFIREHKDQRVTGPDGVAGLRWGVEPMCTVLTEHGVPIAPATYYEWVSRQPSRRQLPDEQVAALIRAQREDPKTGKFAATLGSRKMWLRSRAGS